MVVVVVLFSHFVLVFLFLVFADEAVIFFGIDKRQLSFLLTESRLVCCCYGDSVLLLW